MQKKPDTFNLCVLDKECVMTRGLFVLALLMTPFMLSCDKKEARPAVVLEDINELVLYDLEGLKGLSYSQDTIRRAPRYVVDKVKVKQIFADVRLIDRRVLWKGSLLGVASTNNGARVAIAMSYHSCYFRVLGDGRNYQAVGDSSECFDSVMMSALKDVFHPARRYPPGDPWEWYDANQI